MIVTSMLALTGLLISGLLTIVSAWRAWQGEDGGLFASGLIGISYLLTGVPWLAYLKEVFRSTFVLLGGLALVVSVTLAVTGCRLSLS